MMSKVSQFQLAALKDTREILTRAVALELLNAFQVLHAGQSLATRVVIRLSRKTGMALHGRSERFYKAMCVEEIKA